MSDETERDDAILGTALARAVESQHLRETPYERSRIAARLAAPARGFPLGALAMAATFVVAVGLAAFVLVPRGTPAEPSVPPPEASLTPAATETAVPQVLLRVFFARDLLPPMGADVGVPLGSETSPERRIRARLEALATAKAPGGAMNMVPTLRTHPTLKDVRIDGDLVTIDYTVPNGDWGSAGSAGTLALIQQLVYTASEEPGIRRVLITENGGKETIIDQVQVDHPVTREDVFGYSFKGTEVTSIESAGTDLPQILDKWNVSNDDVPGLGRFSVEVRAQGNATGGRLDPRFTARLVQPVKTCTDPNCLEGKWRIQLMLSNTTLGTGEGVFVQRSGGSPVRGADGQIVRGDAGAGPASPPAATITIHLDDARPWRVSIEPTGTGTTRINVDVGGRPSLVSRSIAVYGLDFGMQVPRSFTVAGAARVFEANVVWRLRNARGDEVATGHTLATMGTSPVWGTFEARVDVPSGVSGNVTLEVFWPSPKDGSDLDPVQIPLSVR